MNISLKFLTYIQFANLSPKLYQTKLNIISIGWHHFEMPSNNPLNQHQAIQGLSQTQSGQNLLLSGMNLKILNVTPKGF